jgi:hypothetical protein
MATAATGGGVVLRYLLQHCIPLPVGLMNGERLVDLLIENDIGITRTSYDLIEMGEDGIPA